MFSKKENRLIFEYFDGERTRKVDPLTLWRRMWQDPECDPESDFTAAVYDYDAYGRVLNLARNMFEIKAYSEKEKGLTEGETLDLLWKFVDFSDKVKKKHGALPIPSARLESTSMPEKSTTKPDSDSNSTENESTNEEPTVS